MAVHSVPRKPGKKTMTGETLDISTRVFANEPLYSLPDYKETAEVVGEETWWRADAELGTAPDHSLLKPMVH